MKEYDIIITETLQMTVTEKANSRKEAIELARANWKKGEYILDANSFKAVQFQTEKAVRESQR